MKCTVHFSNIKSEIISSLKKATIEIKVAVAWLTDEDIIRVLSQKAQSGIDVQIVVSDSKENFRNTSKFKDLLRFGKLNVATPKFLHHKFCIIDKGLIISGSYNWTYFAQKNEENIVVMTIESNSSEDNKLLTAFEGKYKFLSDKVSVQIIDISDLDRFREQGKVAAILLAQLDEEEIRLRQELEGDVKKSLEESRRLGIGVSEYLLERMQLDGGGVEFIKRILHDEMFSGEMKSGFKRLEEPIPHRVDLSLEFLASRPKYQNLFKVDEIHFCKKLMKKYNL